MGDLKVNFGPIEERNLMQQLSSSNDLSKVEFNPSCII